MADTSTPAGTWYTLDNGFQLGMTITPSGSSFTGVTDASQTLDNFSWDPTTRILQFRRIGNGWWQWYRVTIAYGVFAGRFSHSTTSGSQPAISEYVYHVTGWNATFLDAATSARTWDCIVNVQYRCRLAIDKLVDGTWVGTFKTYATVSGGIGGEALEEDLTSVTFDGTTLRFNRPLVGQTYVGTVHGNQITGTFTQQSATYNWSGSRSEVLSHGMAPMTQDTRNVWQERVRGALQLLMQAGNPHPSAASVQVIRTNVSPIPVTTLPPNRDDNPNRTPQNYTLTELQWTYVIPNPYGGTPTTRFSHGYLATPSDLKPGEKRPAVVAVNGHGGSAYAVMDGGNGTFWYGDGWARRGYVVLAIDISHRNDSPVYPSTDAPNGDDAAHGNGPHPSIKYAPFNTTDWEEYGERAWDTSRGLDYLLTLPMVDSTKVVLTGISMGGCVTSHAGALDTRFAVVIPSGSSPDVYVEFYNPGAHICYRWAWANFREYHEYSDLHALVAPRPLIVMTGKQDTVYDNFSPPFVGDKQVMRRAATAYAETPDNIIHYLHYCFHTYQFGGYSPGLQPPAGFQNGVQRTRITGPVTPGDMSWQTDASTQPDTLFDLVGRFLNNT